MHNMKSAIVLLRNNDHAFTYVKIPIQNLYLGKLIFPRIGTTLSGCHDYSTNNAAVTQRGKSTINRSSRTQKSNRSIHHNDNNFDNNIRDYTPLTLIEPPQVSTKDSIIITTQDREEGNKSHIRKVNMTFVMHFIKNSWSCDNHIQQSI